MAIPIPLIGSSFDSLGSQRLAWQNRNDSVDAGNFQRAAQAQEIQNRYNFDVARMQQEAAARDATMQAQQQQQAIALALQKHQDNESSRRFDVQTGLTREEMAARDKQFQFNVNERRRPEQEADQTAENFADTMKDQVAELGDRADTALETLNKAQAKLAQTAAEKERTLIPGTWVKNRSGDYLPNPKGLAALQATDPEKYKQALDAIGEANVEVAKLGTEAEAAQNVWNTHANNFDSLKKRAGQYGLEVTKKDGKYSILNPKTRQFYFGSAPLGVVAPPATESVTEAQPQLPSWVMAGQPPQDAMPTEGSGTTAPIPLVAPQAAPPVSVPSNPYVAGKRYGNMRYLGGDPSSETSWQPVQ